MMTAATAEKPRSHLFHPDQIVQRSDGWYALDEELDDLAGPFDTSEAAAHYLENADPG